jgi:hypothetical protein
MLTMFYPRQEFPLGGPIGVQFVRDDHVGHVGYAIEPPAEELPGGLLIPTALPKHIELALS